jgi:hypothetical protein
VLFNLTSVIWITQILRQVDLITNQGQTILMFLRITSLLLPILMLVIAPIAMVTAICYALIKLNGDSELVVMNAAGIAAPHVPACAGGFPHGRGLRGLYRGRPRSPASTTPAIPMSGPPLSRNTARSCSVRKNRSWSCPMAMCSVAGRRSTTQPSIPGVAAGQCCGNLGFDLGAGLRGLFLGLDGTRPDGDEAIDRAQCCLLEAAGAGRRDGLHLGGRAAAAIGADDALLGDDVSERWASKSPRSAPTSSPTSSGQAPSSRSIAA